MNNILSRALLFWIVLFNISDAIASLQSEPSKKNKSLILIVASDDLPVYLVHENIWRAYMHSDPEHFEAYFIKADPDLDVPCKIIGDVIWSKTEKDPIPGILDKTLLSMESLLPRINEFDYIIRTNLSSFYVLPRLHQFLMTLPKYQCYCGIQSYDLCEFVSGAGILLSSDLVELMVKNQKEIEGRFHYPEDVWIGCFFQAENITPLPAPRTDITSWQHWLQSKDNIPTSAFHFRLKNSNPELRLQEESNVHQALVEMFYGTPSKTPK